MHRRQAMGAMMAGGLAAVGASAAAAQDQGAAKPKVWLDLDQQALDAQYDQANYAPNMLQVVTRFVTNGQAMRARIGPPSRAAYGPRQAERLDIYRTAKARAPAPVLVFIHGGAWRSTTAQDYSFLAEMFVAAGAHFVGVDFDPVQDVQGDLGAVADQVRRALLWTHAHAAEFGGDPDRIYVAGHSSGAHLAGVMLTTDWPALGAPVNLLKGGACISGLYDLTPVRLTYRASYIHFTDAAVEALSPIRRIERLHAPILLFSGSYESPEFQRQSKAFAQACQAAGKPAPLLIGQGYNHFEMAETAANPFGVAGRAILAQMQLKWS